VGPGEKKRVGVREREEDILMRIKYQSTACERGWERERKIGRDEETKRG
jgi:hypothetical protein